MQRSAYNDAPLVLRCLSAVSLWGAPSAFLESEVTFLALFSPFKDLALDHGDYTMALERVQTPACMFAYEYFLTKLPV